MAGRFSGMTRRNIEKSAFIERLPFTKLGGEMLPSQNWGVSVDGWLLQKSQIVEIFLFGKIPGTAENQKKQIPS